LKQISSIKTFLPEPVVDTLDERVVSRLARAIDLNLYFFAVSPFVKCPRGEFSAIIDLPFREKHLQRENLRMLYQWKRRPNGRLFSEYSMSDAGQQGLGKFSIRTSIALDHYFGCTLTNSISRVFDTSSPTATPPVSRSLVIDVR